MPTLRKILVVVVLLGVGLIVGYELGQRKAPRPITREQAEPPARPVHKNVKFKRVGTKLVEDHQPVYLSVHRREQIVWESGDFKDFEVSVVPYGKEAAARLSETYGYERPSSEPPACPFLQAKEGCLFGGTNGRAESGPGKREAVGHWYKLRIRAGSYELDPHIYFHDGGKL